MENTQDQLSAIRIEEISRILDHFQNVNIPVTDELLAEHCKLNKYDILLKVDYDDYKFQREQDVINTAFYKDMLEALSGLQYVPTFVSSLESKKITEHNEEVRVKIAMLIEDHKFLFRLLDSTLKNMANTVFQTIELANTTAWNKARRVLNVLAREKFGDEFNMGHAKQFVIDFMEKETGTKVTDESLK